MAYPSWGGIEEEEEGPVNGIPWDGIEVEEERPVNGISWDGVEVGYDGCYPEDSDEKFYPTIILIQSEYMDHWENSDIENVEFVNKKWKIG